MRRFCTETLRACGSPRGSVLRLRHAWVVLVFPALAMFHVTGASATPPGTYLKAVGIAASELERASNPQLPVDGGLSTEEERFAFRCGYSQGWLSVIEVIEFGASGYDSIAVDNSLFKTQGICSTYSGLPAPSYTPQENAYARGFHRGGHCVVMLVLSTEQEFLLNALRSRLSGQQHDDKKRDSAEFRALVILQSMAAQVETSKIPDMEYFSMVADRADPAREARRQKLRETNEKRQAQEPEQVTSEIEDSPTD